MQNLTLEQAADYLETATLEATHAIGHAVVNIGTNAAGARFVMLNDMHGNSALTEAL